ncbi:MAG: zinc ribbon domain-containing protein [Verrucomicrobia bacterium]|nr:zinc ribbon domain-containing protein [Verrucomicrobiota bacterium]
MFCNQCGAVIENSARFCSACGNSVVSAQSNASPPGASWNSAPGGFHPNGNSQSFAQGKSKYLALVFSLIIVGLGQFYNGDFKKGAFMLVGAVLGGIISLSALWWVMALWSALDAYQVANGTKPLWK